MTGMKKITLTGLSFVFATFAMIAQERVVFLENFESTSKPEGWENEMVIGDDGTAEGEIVNWRFETGGYYGYPAEAYQGEYNAIFQKQSSNGEITKLITPAIDLKDVLKPELRFGHIQQAWYVGDVGSIDQLKVYYKRGLDSSWVLLKSYPDGIETWTEQVIQLPDSSKSATYYLGFEGINNWGYGTCIDSVRIIETGVKAKKVENILVKQGETEFIPTEWVDVPILNVQFQTSGNEGELTLDSLKVTSLNQNDNYIATNGIKLYATSDTTWRDPILVGNGISFENGEAAFRNLNYDLPRGYSSVWVTYDIVEATDHDIHNAIVDAKIKAEQISVNGSHYPLIDASPEGHALLQESLYHKGFETSHNWALSGFEVGAPQGLGPSYAADPTTAYSGTNVLGTDLSEDGLYANQLSNRELTATSPIVNANYYRNVNLIFARWLNIEFNDSAYIDLSIDNKSTWQAIWENTKITNIQDKQWTLQTLALPTARFKEKIAMRYALGGTNISNNWSGWNIDNVTIIGDFISRDVGITAITLPAEGCGHTAEDIVEVTVQNFGGEATNDTIPVQYSLDGGNTWSKDTLFTSLDVGEGQNFTFTPKADLSTPGFYTLKVTTKLPGDETPENDAMEKSFYVYPTLSPAITQRLENNDGNWHATGENLSWEHGTPAGTNLDAAHSGENAWVTNLNGNYQYSDSSFLNSPCFDLTGVEAAIFQFWLNADLEENTDGMALHYSLDEGNTWQLLEAQGTFPWSWYTSDNITALESPGWDTLTAGWIQQRVMLPQDAINAGQVKFRFAFASNASLNLEGVAIDDLSLFAAPYNVAVTHMSWPQTQCELSDTTHVNIAIKNTGYSSMESGTQIPIGIDFNNEFHSYDTLTLTEPLAVNESINYQLDTVLDMSYAGDYSIELYTLLEEDPFFYAEAADDTLSSTVSVTGMPNYDIGDVVGVETPVNTTLDAGAGYTTYEWKQGTNETVVGNEQTLNVTSEGLFHVTVTNAVGCEASDTLQVVGSLEDVQVAQIITPLEDSCLREVPTSIQIELTNQGLMDYNINDTIPLAYQINNEEPVIDTLFLSSQLNRVAPNETALFTFAQHADFREAENYTLQVYSTIPKDLDRSNDTLTVSFNTWGATTINLSNDTLYSSQADTLTLDAGSGYATYEWQDGTSTQTYDLTDNTTQWYKITITDVHGCGEASDSTLVITDDLGIEEIVNPVSDCEHDEDEQIRLRIRNNSGNTLASGSTINVAYSLNEGTPVTDVLTLPLEVEAASPVELNLNQTIDASQVGDYTLQIWLTNELDANRTDDTLATSFTTKGRPDVELAYDTLLTTQPDTLELDAGEGFNAYVWNTSATTQTITPHRDTTFTYVVEVSKMDGCGTDKDSTTIITKNLSLVSMESPENACELTNDERVRIVMKNNSPNNLYAGEEIEVGYRLNNGNWVVESFTTHQDIDPKSTFAYEFTQTIDMSAYSVYTFDLYVEAINDADRTDDSLTTARKTFGYPEISLAYDQIKTTQPDTVMLVVTPGYTSYKWNEGTKNDTLMASQSNSYNYVVTVSDANGCESKDSTQVYTYDLAATAITSPVEACAYSTEELISIELTSLSEDTLAAGESIPVAYRLNEGSWIEESVVLEEQLSKNGLISYTFTTPANMEANQLHTLKAKTIFPNEANTPNDATTYTVDALAPNFDLGEPVNTTESSYTLDAGSGYSAYLWFDGSTEQTYTVEMNDQSTNQYYSVTVENAEGCSTTDSVQVLFNFEADLGVSQVRTPASGCLTEEDVFMDITFMNLGTSTIPSGTQITVGYEHENMTPITETVTLSSELASNGTIDYQFTNPVVLSNNSSYLFKVYTAYSNDNNASNDTLTKGVDIEDPLVDLGPDTLTVEEFPYFLDAGDFETYVWSTGDTKQTIEAPGPGDYSVTVTDAQGCIAIDSIYLDEHVGWEDLQKSSSIDIYPNPVNNLLYLEFNERETSDYTIVLLNMAGEQVYFKNLKRMSEDAYQINVSNYAQGIYYLLIRWDDKFYTEKIIIE
ncbi:MAG: T9SS type A sorting domain-containing protein [Bacteroidota bacterium]